MSAPLAKTARNWLPDGTTTLAMAWVSLTVYGFLSTLTNSGMPLRGWIGMLITLLVVWSVMERKRWGRLALFDIALLTLADAAYAVYRLQLAPQPLNIDKLRDAPTLVIVLRAYDGGPLFGLLLLTLCALTMMWLLWKPVVAEFEHRKRMATRRYQVYIALALVLGWGTNQVNQSVSHTVGNWLDRSQSMPIQQINTSSAGVFPLKASVPLEDR